MKFKTRGTFETEALIDIAQRAVACLQDAGAERVASVSVYLTVVDRHGAPCPLCLDGETLDQLDLDMADLALAVPPARLVVGKPHTSRTARSAARPTQKRRRS
jgi:hypothetical protein